MIEALAAIAVMMIVIPVILQGFTIAGVIASQARKRADATALAQSKLDELMATQQWQSGVSGGDETIGPNTFHWEPSLEQWDSGEINIQVLKMRVSWEVQGGEQRDVIVTTLVWQPDSSIQTSTGGVGGILP